MATVNKNFKIKQGLIVEGSTATVNGNQVLTENASDQYIINLIGGETLVTSVNSSQLQVINGELSVKSNVFDSYGSAADAETNANSYTDGEISTALTTAQGYANTAESNANSYTNTALNDYTTTANLDTTIDGYGYLKSADLSGYATETYADNAASGAQSAAETFATNAINALDTDDIEEGVSNQYYTDARARGAVSAGDGLNYDSNTGAFTAHLGNGLEISGGAIRIDDSVVATETDLTNAITAHDVTTGVHGLAGDVVGTTDTQTISNKTLGSDLAAGGFQITNLGAPQNSTDAATKAYVDAVSEGLHVHAAARVAVQGNISIATGLENGDSAGGVTLVTGDRVLVKDQTVASENGIYVVQTSGQALRATDFDTATEVASGDFIFVTEGTYANTGWVQTNNPATIGTDPISFTQFSGAGAFTAGNGLTLNGTEFSINDTITATVTYVDTEIGDHASDTGTHGVTEIVGVSESQTLTNKTLGSSTVLGANLDAANTYTVANLQEPVNNQDAATKFYVDGEISSVTGTIDNLTTTDISEGTNLYFTNQRALDATSAAYDPAGSAATAQSNAEDYADGLAVNYDPAGSASTAQSNAETFATNAINALDTDDIEEGITNQYFTTGRAQSAAADLLTGASLTNITITGSGAGLTITAENGVDDSTTDDLAEGTTNKYYSDSLVDNHLSGGDGITYSAGTISASVGSGLSTATGDIVVDRNTTDTWYDAAGAASTAQTNAETFATNAINALDTDDIEEGATNKYFSDTLARGAVSAGTGISYDSGTGVISVDNTIATESYVDTAVNNLVDGAPGLLDTLNEIAAAINDDENYFTTVANQINAKQDTLTAGSNIDITSNTISVTGLDTDDVAEGSNLYFTDQRAVDAITNANIYPTMVDINDYRREEATQQYVGTASTVTAHSFTGNWSVKYLARIVGTVSGTLHSQVTEILVTVDGAHNVAVTEYGSIYTSEEPLATFTADYDGSATRLRATTANNGMEVVVAATMLSWAD